MVSKNVPQISRPGYVKMEGHTEVTTTHKGEVKIVPKHERKANTRNILEVMAAFMGLVLSADVEGFNVIHAVLYAYRFLRSIRGGRDGKDEGDNPSQHDPRERGSKVRGTGGYGRQVDENTILDIVQSGFLIYFLSQRGRKGQKPENLDTRKAMGRAVSKWYKKEKKHLRITTDAKAIAARMERLTSHVDSSMLSIPEMNTPQTRKLIALLASGKSKADASRELSVSKAYVSKLLKSIRNALAKREQAATERATPVQASTLPASGVQHEDGSWVIPTVDSSSEAILDTVGHWTETGWVIIPSDCIRHDDTDYFPGTVLTAEQRGSKPIVDPLAGHAGDGILRHSRLFKSGFLSPLPLLDNVPFLAWGTDYSDGTGI